MAEAQLCKLLSITASVLLAESLVWWLIAFPSVVLEFYPPLQLAIPPGISRQPHIYPEGEAIYDPHNFSSVLQVGICATGPLRAGFPGVGSA